jgi:hypothetical protein
MNYIKKMALGCCSCCQSSTNILPSPGFTTDKTLAKVGWIAYNNNGITEYYNPKSADASSLTAGNIIGIVVIEAAHTGDGTVRVVSLDYMDYNNPTTGSTTSVSMYWGGYGSLVPNLDAINKAVYYVDGTTTTALGTGKFPTDYNYQPDHICITDPQAWYTYAPSYYGYKDILSPYAIDGGRNFDYFNTPGSILSQGLCGAENTDKIMADVTHTGDIQNESGAGYHPAAECCRAYKDGSWYLPSQAELGYLCVRLKEIEFARTTLGRDSLTTKYYCSSS